MSQNESITCVYPYVRAIIVMRAAATAVSGTAVGESREVPRPHAPTFTTTIAWPRTCMQRVYRHYGRRTDSTHMSVYRIGISISGFVAFICFARRPRCCCSAALSDAPLPPLLHDLCEFRPRRCHYSALGEAYQPAPWSVRPRLTEWERICRTDERRPLLFQSGASRAKRRQRAMRASANIRSTYAPQKISSLTSWL